MKQRNTEHWQNSRTPQNSGGTMEHSSKTPAEHPQIQIPTEHQHVTPVDQPGTTAKQRTIVVSLEEI